MREYDFLFLSGTDDGTVDLGAGGADTGEDLGEDAGKDDGAEELKQLDTLLKKHNIVGFKADDPRVAKAMRPEKFAEPTKAGDPSADDAADAELEELLIKDPRGYAKKIQERATAAAQSQVGEASKLQRQLLREIRTAVPELPDKAFEELEEQIEGASLADLRKWKEKGGHVTAAKAAAHDDRKANPNRKPNAPAERLGGGGSSDRIEPGLQKQQDMMLQALNDAGIKVDAKDLATSEYHPRGR